MVKHRKSQVGPYDTYVRKIIQKKNKDVKVSKKSIKVLSSMILDLHHRYEAVLTSGLLKKKTLNALDMQTATRLLLSGELSKHAVNEGTKAVFVGTNKEMTPEKKEEARPTLKPARVMRLLRRDRVAARISPKASWYLAGVLDYVTGEIADMAQVQVSSNKKRNMIKPRNIYLAVQGDEELQPLFRGTFASSGVFESQKQMDETKKATKKASKK